MTRQFRILNVEFDFDSDNENDIPGSQEQVLIEDSFTGESVFCDDEDEIADLLSDASGWCVLNLNYEEVFPSGVY